MLELFPRRLRTLDSPITHAARDSRKSWDVDTETACGLNARATSPLLEELPESEHVNCQACAYHRLGVYDMDDFQVGDQINCWDGSTGRLRAKTEGALQLAGYARNVPPWAVVGVVRAGELVHPA